MVVTSRTLHIAFFIGATLLLSPGNGFCVRPQTKKTDSIKVLGVTQTPVNTNKNTTPTTPQPQPGAKSQAKKTLVPSAQQPGIKQLPDVTGLQKLPLPVLTVFADKDQVQLGERVTFHLEPQALVARAMASPAYRFVYDYDDQNSKDTTASHRFTSAGTHKVSVSIETAAGVPFTRITIIPKPITVDQVKLTAPTSVQVGVPVLLVATSSSTDPSIRYWFQFDDNDKSEPQWQEPNQSVSHVYLAPRTYKPTVKVGFYEDGEVIGPFDSISTPVNVTAPPPESLGFDARLDKDNVATLTATFPKDERQIRYRFVLDRGEQPTDWQVKPETTQPYGPGLHYPSVEVGVFVDGDVKPLIRSPEKVIEVTAPPNVVLSPTPLVRPTKPTQPTNDWPPYLILILIAGLLFLIGTIWIVAKAAKSLFPTPAPPTFVAYPNIGSASNGQGANLVDFELHLDPNLAAGLYAVVTSEPNLVRAERNHP